MPRKNPAAVELGRRGGRASAKKLTPEQRRESARRAAQARWAKTKKLVQEISKGSEILLKKAQEADGDRKKK